MSHQNTPLLEELPTESLAPLPVEAVTSSHEENPIILAISSITSRYRILEKIGHGASADVYLALDTHFNRHVALKRFNAESLSAAPAESDYLSEVAAVSQLSHSHVVRAYDLDDDEEGPFIIFELIDGIDLEQKLKQGPMSADDVRHFITQALEALIFIHQKGITHLDLKPANFMVTDTACGIPHYTLIDFGRACDAELERKRRETKGKKSLRGSIHYMAPEQFTNGILDARTDLYAIGVMAYELLTGSYPFDGDNTVQVMAAHLTGRVQAIDQVLPGLPPGIAPWIMSLIAKDPEVRPASAEDALRSLLSLSTLRFTPLEISEPFPALEKTA